MILTENTAKYAGGNYFKSRWLKDRVEEDTRTGDEIAMDIITRAGLRAKGGEADGA